MKRGAAWLALFLALSWPGAAADGWTLEDLADAIGAEGRKHVRFVEEHHLGILSVPLMTEGTLAFEPPDRFVRQDLVPKVALYELQGSVLQSLENGSSRSFDTRQQPLLADLLLPLQALLTGDLGLLDARYATELEGTRADWRLRLTPLGEPTSSRIEAIRVQGRGGEVDLIETRESDGDAIIMRLKPAS